MAKKSIMFVLLAFVLLISASAVLADQEGTAVWCNIDEYGCYNDVDGAKEYIMFWSEDAAALFMGPDSGATVTPRPKGITLKGKNVLSMKGPFPFDYGFWYAEEDEEGNVSAAQFSPEYWSCTKEGTGYTCWHGSDNFLD